MRISLNWLKKFVDIKISDDELVRLIGARLVEVEGVIHETHKYDNIYVVRVASAEKIPDTHLTLCQIDAGDVEVAKVEKNDGLIQVVCGAPNVREGMLAAWIAPGAISTRAGDDKEECLSFYSDADGSMKSGDELSYPPQWL
jgi:phenylalanyl-tRNA synthetase beta chain